MESNFKSPHISEEDWIQTNTFSTHQLWLKFWRFEFSAPQQRERGLSGIPAMAALSKTLNRQK